MVNKEILDSWKEIGKYLGRDTRTCYRWEKELGLPVHRIDNNSLPLHPSNQEPLHSKLLPRIQQL